MTFRCDNLFPHFLLELRPSKSLVKIFFSVNHHTHDSLQPDFHQTVDKLKNSGTAEEGNVRLGCS